MTRNSGSLHAALPALTIAAMRRRKSCRCLVGTILTAALTVSGLELVIAAADQPQEYPPAGFAKTEKDVAAPDGKFHIEQWWQQGAGEGGQSYYQTWLVPSTGPAVRLPEAPLPEDLGSGDSGTVGFPSSFVFSPDGKYLFREQKIAHAINGAYLYRHDGDLTYEVAVPDLMVRASKFFSAETKLKWDDETGVVEFSIWRAKDTLGLRLRGYSEERRFAIENWRCLYDPTTGAFSVRQEWQAPNKHAIIKNR